MLSLSARHLADHDGHFDGVEKGEKLLHRAKELLIEEMSATKPRITTIQGLLILGGRQCAIGKNSEGWLYTGMAIKMLEDTGLHLRLPDSKLIELERCTPVDIEIRKRVYNSAYIWEKTMCLALGRPPSLIQQPYSPIDILDHFDDRDEWMPVHAPEIAARYVPHTSLNTAVFCAHAQLHRISTDMMALFFTISAEDPLSEGIEALEKRMDDWYSNLPDQLRIEDPSQMHQSPPPHIVSLNVLYQALTVLLHRPSLMTNDIELASLGTRTCSSASQNILAILALYERTFPYRLMTYQVSYCVFTAATAQAYIMRHADGKLAEDAARTVSSAMRILQQETKHTPGISGSLDTLRKQLMMSKVVRKGRIVSRPATDVTPENSRTDLPHLMATTNKERSSPFDNYCDYTMINQPSIDLSQSTYQGHEDIRHEQAFGIGGIDTGGGFQPSVFPWTFTIWLGAGDWMGCN